MTEGDNNTAAAVPSPVGVELDELSEALMGLDSLIGELADGLKLVLQTKPPTINVTGIEMGVTNTAFTTTTALDLTESRSPLEQRLASLIATVEVMSTRVRDLNERRAV